ncbi:probable glutamate--tRNA ligase, mitochondrial [Contarinia nasturtii]|uniref:probable glutamate--tRNA ligase, mitochondrial n=1 Tax=Contarinia nasturtii TaxID=265458 RepID=UPI0012D378AA|nr:probable glutamate--tRNA ligase, mitochondrial [Contarinia nasturtii]
MLFRINSIKLLLLKRNTKSVFRYCSTQQSDDCTQNVANKSVRVRFAPSPTGYLHLGGLRTALYNYLFAKANRGAFIVRIEDTDQTRTVKNAQETLFKNLEWAGIKPDESVIHGGDFGPYVQSKRLDLYDKHLKKLISNGHAYYCFCTERRLELLRRDAMRANEIPKYDNRCRHLHSEKVAEKLASNHPKIVRFKLNSMDETFIDLIYGEKTFSMQSEGDFVIQKSDGYPTYHFANVVDDHLMGISHVLRGVEWQVSTPKHLAMYRAFDWTPPLYAHLPLILNTNGTKLSKRQDDANVDYYKERGIFPRALNNFITRNGGGFKWDSSILKNHSMDELIQAFDITKMHSYPSRLQNSDLYEINALEIQRQVNDPILIEKLVEQARQLIKDTFPENIDSLDLGDAHIKNALKFASDNLNNLGQLVEGDPSFLWVLPELTTDYVQPEWMNSLIAELESTEFTKQILVVTLRNFARKEGINFGQMMRLMRSLLSSKKDGYQVAEMLEILGKDGSIERLSRTPTFMKNSEAKSTN